MGEVQRILELARADRRRIVFPEGDEPRTLHAARRLHDEKIAVPILVGDPETLRVAAESADVDLAGIEIEDPQAGEGRRACLEAATEALAGKSADPEQALADPLWYGAAMVRAGRADGSVAGARSATPDVLRAALRILRPAPGVRVVSSFFFMALRRPTAGGDGALLFADCGLVPYPDAGQLAEIARHSAASYRLLCRREPRVALLSFSTHGSAAHEAVERVRQATKLLAESEADFVHDGELQLDAALVPEVARSKAPESAIRGSANVLVFPNLDAGNIGYKLVERLAGAQAVGPIVQGLSRPANDLSRGCAVDDIVVAAAVTALQAAAGQV